MILRDIGYPSNNQYEKVHYADTLWTTSGIVVHCLKCLHCISSTTLRTVERNDNEIWRNVISNNSGHKPNTYYHTSTLPPAPNTVELKTSFYT